MKTKSNTFTLLVLTITLALTVTVSIAQQGRGGGGGAPAAAAAPMTLTTTGWMDGAVIPNKYTQAAPMAVSPDLKWANVPAGTQSFVLHFHDPDVSKNNTTADQVHWLVWNIPATSTGFSENQPMGPQLPDGSRQISASGSTYRGPGAPANGPYHHYTFEIYALDIKLDSIPAVTMPVAAGATPNPNDELQTRDKVFAAMQGHVRGKAVMGGLFKRPQ